MTPDAAIPTSLVSVLVVAVTALAATVVFLFKHFSGKAEEQANERRLWAVERTKLEDQLEAERLSLRAEYETKLRVVVEDSAKEIRDLYENAREWEATARREYLVNMEVVAGEAKKAHDKIGAILDKALDRFVGTKPKRQE